MFLVTTNDTRYRKPNEPLLLLGEWCRSYKEKIDWNTIPCEVLPFHGDNREAFYRNYVFAKETYEAILPELAHQLNLIHGVSHSVHYWRILVGSWLWFFIDCVLDRFLAIEIASASGRVSNTWLASSCEIPPPNDCSGFLAFQNTESYNQFIFQKLILHTKKIPYEIRSDLAVTLLTHKPKCSARGSVLKRLLTNSILVVQKLVPSFLTRVVLVDSYFDRLSLFKLFLKLKQFPLFFKPSVNYSSQTFDRALRAQIRFSETTDSFKSFLYYLIPEQIPFSYIENYRHLKHSSLNAFPKAPRLIATANASISDDGFKIWAAEHFERGVKLAAIQYGGCYGSGRWLAFEEYERSLSHRYFSWGWRDNLDDRVVPVSGAKLISSVKKIGKPSTCGPILWLMTSTNTYSYGLVSLPAGPQILNFISDQAKFFHALPSKVQALMRIRPYPKDLGWNDQERLADLMPNVVFSSTHETFYRQVAQCRLCICTNNATVHLETMAANFPTVIFWDQVQTELRADAVVFHDELHRVKILHHSPLEAAQHVAAIWENPLGWWLDPEVQQVRKRFVERFACTRKNWIDDWARAINQLWQ